MRPSASRLRSPIPEVRWRHRRAGLLLASLCLTAVAADARERFVYGGDHRFAPHEYLDEQGQPAGFNVDVVRLLARESGRDVEVRLGPWDEQLRAFGSGEIDVMSLAWSSSRAERYALLVRIWTLRQGCCSAPGASATPRASPSWGARSSPSSAEAGSTSACSRCLPGCAP